MKQMKNVIFVLIGFVVLLIVGGFMVSNYSYVFAKRVKGKILDVQRVTDPSAFLGSKATAEQMHSYSVLIQGDDGRLYTSSSEDRQWQVATKGYCVEALLYRYPPWDFKSANTFFNARLVELFLCAGETAPANPAQLPKLPSEPAAHAPAPPTVPQTPEGAPSK